MARTISQSRLLTGFSALTTTTQALAISPGSLPDGATLTRTLGQVQLEYLPAAGSAARALIVLGLAVTDDVASLDVALPNSQPEVWVWWYYAPLTLDLRGSSGAVQVPTFRYLDYDVSGQRITNTSAGKRLYVLSRLVSPISAGVAAIRLSATQFYKLPA